MEASLANVYNKVVTKFCSRSSNRLREVGFDEAMFALCIYLRNVFMFACLLFYIAFDTPWELPANCRHANQYDFPVFCTNFCLKYGCTDFCHKIRFLPSMLCKKIMFYPTTAGSIEYHHFKTAAT